MTATSPAYVLAAPVDPLSRRVWDVRVYRSGTGEKLPAAKTVVDVADRDVRLALDHGVRGLGWQRTSPLGWAHEPFYAWDVWPLPSADVPDWADASPGGEWDESDGASGDLSVTHKRVVGTVGDVVVAVARTDRARAGVVTLGEIRVSVGEVGDGLTPDEADTLCEHVLAAARLAIELRAAAAAGGAPIVVSAA
jgi:hypothetical protein